jgi:hypothetical protein
MVVINGAGNTTVVFLSTELDQGLQVAQLERQRVFHHGVGRFAQRGSCERLTLHLDDLRALLPFGLGLPSGRG